ncbi:hypothetical protein CLV79_11550 [Limimaricola soesokkakensis]|uniref:Uncharacterized protein n=1 Tax=Limimaricola soesokkakensis TaxID=1343159 RepID=A0A1X7A134_9RHOB|nr:hypothetical protein [Limimaricola soesokkakensis]PSK81582.1 hypothetical protein CLV79_11550 [Limimaricola soesokkakensis]SLN67493.1 hypothetical protein LOS8367_03373 [Limimaricola soesokkakensis]
MSDPAPPSLAERLEQRVAAQPVPPRTSRLAEIIAARGTLRRLRDAGYGSAQLAAWLEECGVPVQAGTLRAYLARIDRAERALAAENLGAPPSDREILAACRQGFIRDAARSRPALRVSKTGRAPGSVQAAPRAFATPMSSLTHNPHRDL